MDNLKLEIKHGIELTVKELDAVNSAKAREWKILPMDENHRKKTLFALLKDQMDNIIVQGELIPLEKVSFNGEIFSVIGIGGIITNQKGHGFGKKLMIGIKEYLDEQGKAGLGFSGNDVIEFYVKSGYKADWPSLKRFVHEKDGQKITNQDQEVVFYTDSNDQFMKKVLAYPEIEVYLPRDPDW